MDRDTGRPRGFGFVEMDDAGAQAAIAALNGKNIDGRDLTVNEARPEPPVAASAAAVAVAAVVAAAAGSVAAAVAAVPSRRLVNRTGHPTI